MNLAKFRVTPTGVGSAEIEINGTRVDNGTQAVTLKMAVGDIPRLTLEMIGDPEPIEGEGIVTIYRNQAGEGTLLQHVLSWIESLDPAELTAMATDQMSSMSLSPAEAFLGAFTRKARTDLA